MNQNGDQFKTKKEQILWKKILKRSMEERILPVVTKKYKDGDNIYPSQEEILKILTNKTCQFTVKEFDHEQQQGVKNKIMKFQNGTQPVEYFKNVYNADSPNKFDSIPIFLDKISPEPPSEFKTYKPVTKNNFNDLDHDDPIQKRVDSEVRTPLKNYNKFNFQRNLRNQSEKQEAQYDCITHSRKSREKIRLEEKKQNKSVIEIKRNLMKCDNSPFINRKKLVDDEDDNSAQGTTFDFSYMKRSLNQNDLISKTLEDNSFIDQDFNFKIKNEEKQLIIKSRKIKLNTDSSYQNVSRQIYQGSQTCKYQDKPISLITQQQTQNSREILKYPNQNIQNIESPIKPISFNKRSRIQKTISLESGQDRSLKKKKTLNQHFKLLLNHGETIQQQIESSGEENNQETNNQNELKYFFKLDSKNPLLITHYLGIAEQSQVNDFYFMVKMKSEQFQKYLLRKYPQFIVDKFLHFSEFPSIITLRQYRNFIDKFNKWHRNDILFMIFNILDIENQGLLTEKSLLNLLPNLKLELLNHDFHKILKYVLKSPNFNDQPVFEEFYRIKQPITYTYFYKHTRGFQNINLSKVKIKKISLYQHNFFSVNHVYQDRLLNEQIDIYKTVQQEPSKLKKKRQKTQELINELYKIDKKEFKINFSTFAHIFRKKLPYLFYDIVFYISLCKQKGIQYKETFQEILQISSQNNEEIDTQCNHAHLHGESKKEKFLFHKAIKQRKKLEKIVENYTQKGKYSFGQKIQALQITDKI